ncbi:MAG TPA: Ku protein [Actinomycetota bacterium]
MPRAVWTGCLAFGLVTIPVRLFPATQPKDVRFHLMDARGRRVRYRRFVADEPERWEMPAERPTEMGRGPAQPPEAEPETGPPPVAEPGREPEGREIAFEDLLHGYETEEGVVLLSREEIKSVRPERSRTIEIEDFVELADIDPVYFDKSYYLSPDRGADKPYGLLLRAMERAGRIGIGRFVLRTKPHLIAIRPASGVLGLETLFFGDEVRCGRELAPVVEGTEVSGASSAWPRHSSRR